MSPLTVVLDTNVLVGSAYAEGSASRRVVAACLRGELVAAVSPALQEEYDHILPRAVRKRGAEEVLRAFLAGAVVVRPAQTPRVVPEDAGDDKLLAAAVAAGAAAVVTNDRHLLSLDPHGSVRILRPTAFLRLWPALSDLSEPEA